MDKKEKAKILYSAIGEIDEELISEAQGNKIKRKSKALILAPLVSVAAILLIITVSLSTVKLLAPKDSSLNLGGSNNAPLPENSETAGTPPSGSSSQDGNINGENLYVADGATLAFIEKSENRYSFKLVITKKQEAIEVTVRGEGTNEWGEPIFVISTTREFAELTHIPTSPPKIFVNGTESTKIPTSPGEYEITVDLSGLESDYLWRNYFTLSPFGNIFR